ncbi:DUF2501 domain-containing protein [Paraburkholderia gardini]|uniref:DUF2501 domain-containing protein n=1 Tax=Paraburkholderia gardini TaxID=2823469 RepID=A0ABM8U6I7_9BURK|nr:DUF2501 domain-containing protein [Paraburkholderia gardini]CAG4908495.1 hypothetical protein R54767_03514 [Paraburkholderia gardini]CAG4915337.1 hypothetical protein R69919_04293 [Paraburkholderia gardini]
MSRQRHRTVVKGFLIAGLLSISTAHAQLSGLLNQAGNSSGSTGGPGNLSGLSNGLSLQSLTSSSTGNVAGVLEFCVKNNYLGGSASSVKDSLMSKLPGGSSSSDSGYTDGSKGILNSGDGKQLDLSGGGLQQQITKQVCDKILAQGKSML